MNNTDRRKLACGKRKYCTKEDVFYTRHNIVHECVQELLNFIVQPNDCVRIKCVDFSAGDGAFCGEIRKLWNNAVCFQYDMAPRSPLVDKIDWFEVQPFEVDIVGFNPPFGYQCGVLKRFLAHAASFKPKYLLFIAPHYPRSLLPPAYTLMKRKVLPSDAFYFPGDEGKVCNVSSCCFFVARREPQPSARPRKTTLEKEILPPGTMRVPRRMWPVNFSSGFAIRRTGVNAGRQVYVVRGTSDVLFVFVGKNGKYVIEPRKGLVLGDGTFLSSIAFVTYVTSTWVPDAAFAHRFAACT